MYYISSSINNKYGVTDTHDGVEEFYTREQIYSFVRKGINITGVSESGIEVCDTTFRTTHRRILVNTAYWLKIPEGNVDSTKALSLFSEVNLDDIDFCVKKNHTIFRSNPIKSKSDLDKLVSFNTKLFFALEELTNKSVKVCYMEYVNSSGYSVPTYIYGDDPVILALDLVDFDKILELRVRLSDGNLCNVRYDLAKELGRSLESPCTVDATYNASILKYLSSLKPITKEAIRGLDVTRFLHDK